MLCLFWLSLFSFLVRLGKSVRLPDVPERGLVVLGSVSAVSLPFDSKEWSRLMRGTINSFFEIESFLSRAPSFEPRSMAFLNDLNVEWDDWDICDDACDSGTERSKDPSVGLFSWTSKAALDASSTAFLAFFRTN